MKFYIHRKEYIFLESLLTPLISVFQAPSFLEHNSPIPPSAGFFLGHKSNGEWDSTDGDPTHYFSQGAHNGVRKVRLANTGNCREPHHWACVGVGELEFALWAVGIWLESLKHLENEITHPWCSMFALTAPLSEGPWGLRSSIPGDPWETRLYVFLLCLHT